MGAKPNRKARTHQLALRAKAIDIATGGLRHPRLNFSAPTGHFVATDKRPSEPLHRTNDAERAFRDRGMAMRNERFDNHPKD